MIRHGFLLQCGVALVLTAMPAVRAETRVEVCATAPAEGENAHYVGNREPLMPGPLIKLRPEWPRVRPERVVQLVGNRQGPGGKYTSVRQGLASGGIPRK
jgi:hypothetical protein